MRRGHRSGVVCQALLRGGQSLRRRRCSGVVRQAHLLVEAENYGPREGQTWPLGSLACALSLLRRCRARKDLPGHAASRQHPHFEGAPQRMRQASWELIKEGRVPALGERRGGLERQQAQKRLGGGVRRCLLGSLAWDGRYHLARKVTALVGCCCRGCRREKPQPLRRFRLALSNEVQQRGPQECLLCMPAPAARSAALSMHQPSAGTSTTPRPLRRVAQ